MYHYTTTYINAITLVLLIVQHEKILPLKYINIFWSVYKL